MLATKNDAEMIRRPHLWPHMYLPLKRVRDSFLETAVVEGLTEKGEVVVHENTTIFGSVGENENRVVYPTPEAVVAAGWIVD